MIYLKKYTLLFALISVLGIEVFAQTEVDSLSRDSTFIDTVIHNVNRIYRESIKTVRLRALYSKHAEPIISINAGSKLELVFDDLSDDYIEFHYDIVHCDKHWNPTQEIKTDYYEGFFTNSLDDYEFSSATKIDYTHYRLIIPGEDERFLRSGNYLLNIIDTEKDSIALTRRFMVVNPMISIKAEVVRTDNVKYMDYRQQVKFQVYDPKTAIQDIGNIYAMVRKNASWDIYCDDIKPSFVNDNRITFERMDACTFEGGNEYRFFNMIEFRNISNNIVRVKIENSGMYSLYLDHDEARSFLKYSSMEDYNGKTLYTSDLKNFNQNELDYASVHFSFKSDEVLLGHEIYLYGELSDFRLDESFKMQFNTETEKYEINKLLKQGLYNYQYVVKSIYQEGPDEGFIEGSHFDTENDYTVYIYYTDVVQGFDQLLGIERINSRKNLGDIYNEK